MSLHLTEATKKLFVAILRHHHAMAVVYDFFFHLYIELLSIKSY